MGWQTLELFASSSPFRYYYLFIFFATLTSYSGHWYLSFFFDPASNRASWLTQNRQVHLWFFIIGFIGMASMGWLLRANWLWIAFAGVPTFLYSAPKIPHPLFTQLKKIAVGKTLFLSLVWTYATTVLPIQMKHVGWTASFCFFLAARFLLIYGICVLFDYRDKAEDKKQGIITLVHFLNDALVQKIFYGIMILFFLCTTWQLRYLSVLTVAILLLPGFIVMVVFNTARQKSSDYLFYFVLDGLMMLSGLLLLCSKFFSW
jgi:1,4-dihydroxy-2-naphthoate octaprenyltransferase